MGENQNDEIGENMLIISELKGFNYYVKELKKIIFVVLFVLLKEEK